MPSVRHATSRPTRPGFSLIELLVVISIIAVLMGILIPTLPRVMDSARRTTCQANMHSIWQAFTMHLGEHSDTFPAARYMPDPWVTTEDDVPSLPQALELYLDGEDSRVWKCPGDRAIFDYEYEIDGHVHNSGCSYKYETALSGNKIEDTFFYRRINLQPTDIPVISDYDAGEFETESGDTITVDFFHQKRNFLFADGRVGDINR